MTNCIKGRETRDNNACNKETKELYTKLLKFIQLKLNTLKYTFALHNILYTDDLTVLEILNLLTIGMSSLNVKYSVPYDIQDKNQFMYPNNLKSPEKLNTISNWMNNHKIKINQKKNTSDDFFNFRKNYQFTTRLDLRAENVEVVSQTKLLGTIIENDLTWNRNTANLVKCAKSRMILLRKLSEFRAPTRPGDLVVPDPFGR